MSRPRTRPCWFGCLAGTTVFDPRRGVHLCVECSIKENGREPNPQPYFRSYALGGKAS